MGSFQNYMAQKGITRENCPSIELFKLILFVWFHSYFLITSLKPTIKSQYLEPNRQHKIK